MAVLSVIYCYKVLMEKSTALLISTYLCTLSVVSVPGLLSSWPGTLTGVWPVEYLTVLIIGGALSGLLTVFLARATCYLFIEADYKTISKP